MNEFNAPTKLSWWIALGLGIVSIIVMLVAANDWLYLAPIIALVGLALMLAASKLTNL